MKLNGSIVSNVEPMAKEIKAMIKNLPFNRVCLFCDLKISRANKIPAVKKDTTHVIR